MPLHSISHTTVTVSLLFYLHTVTIDGWHLACALFLPVHISRPTTSTRTVLPGAPVSPLPIPFATDARPSPPWRTGDCHASPFGAQALPVSTPSASGAHPSPP